MKRLAWITDPHLNFCASTAELWQTVLAGAPDAVLLGGDLTEAPHLERTLLEMERSLGVPIFFVLGNHDFYHGSIEEVRELARRTHHERRLLNYLPEAGVVPLSETTALVGHGGWGDGRYGDYVRSTVRLNDHRLIAEFKGLDSRERLRLMQEIGDRAAEHLGRVLPAALAHYRRAIVLTHVPPFAEASWHEGRMSDPDFLPHFSCKAVGDVLLEEALARDDREILVLCGHTHGSGTVRIRPNLKVVTGGAAYGQPRVQALFGADEPLDRIP